MSIDGENLSEEKKKAMASLKLNKYSVLIILVTSRRIEPEAFD